MRTCVGLQLGLRVERGRECMARRARALCLVFLVVGNAASAEFEIGAKAALPLRWLGGVGWEEILQSTDLENGVSVGMGAGVFAAYRITDAVAIGVEVLVSSLGGKAHLTDASSDYSFSLIVSQTVLEVPLFGRIMMALPFGSLGLYAGPELMVPLGSGTFDAKETYQGESDSASEDADLDDTALFAIAAGVELQYPLGPGFLIGGVRLVVCVTSDADELTRNAVGLMVGYGTRL